MVICSGTLQLLDDPYGVLHNLFSLKAQTVVLDRLPMEKEDRFWLQASETGNNIAWRHLAEGKVFEQAEGYRLIDKVLAIQEAPTREYFCLLFKRD